LLEFMLHGQTSSLLMGEFEDTPSLKLIATTVQ
jgi:hypothetical protein